MPFIYSQHCHAKYYRRIALFREVKAERDFKRLAWPATRQDDALAVPEAHRLLAGYIFYYLYNTKLGSLSDIIH